jgi:hypothetical protein
MAGNAFGLAEQLSVQYFNLMKTTFKNFLSKIIKNFQKFSIKSFPLIC